MLSRVLWWTLLAIATGPPGRPVLAVYALGAGEMPRMFFQFLAVSLWYIQQANVNTR